VVTALLCAMGACGAPTPGPKIAPASQQPVAGALPSMSTGPDGGAENLGVAVSDLHQMDWDTAPLPPRLCGIPTVTTLRGGLAKTTSDTWGGVTVGVTLAAYGDLMGDEGDEAALEVFCDNGGGTAASVLEYGIAVYTGRDGVLTSLGTLAAQVQDADKLPTLVSVEEWRPRSLVVTEEYYRDADSTCCPSGIAETTWVWEEDIPSPGAPHVIH
jgi:hypothetical protein